MPDERTPSQASGPDRPSRWYQQTWLTGLAGFAIGVILTGAVATVVVNDRTNASAAAPTTTISEPTATTSQPTTTTTPESVTVPASCVQAAKLAQQALNAIQDAGRDLSKLDGTALQQTIDKLQGLQTQLREQATACRATANP